MKGLLLVIVVILSACRVQAQKNSSMVGEYYLRGVMETASGFKLNADSTFLFFFSQGAVDREGAGTWSAKNNIILFNSRKRPVRDFALVESKTIPGDSIVVQIKDNNAMILPYVDCSVKTKTGVLKMTTDKEGMARFPAKEVETIGLLFRLCPDRPSIFDIGDSRLNYFSFSFETWIAEVFFENFSLHIEDKELTGEHPLLKGNTFRYEKN